MDSQTFYVLFALVLTTLAMLFYAHLHLPAKIEQRTRESMKAFSTAIELRFPAREGLSKRVVQISREVGKRMDFDAAMLRRLEMAARLRDIGLCSIPYALINEKPRWEWTHSDHATFDRHPEVGSAMLELVPSLSNVANIVRTHQMSYDNSSVPSREDLPMEARVLKVVSDYVWFERTQGPMLARESLRDGMGKAYDPDVVTVLLLMITSIRVDKPAEAVLV